MANMLSTEQMMLINNLLYCEYNSPDSGTNGCDAMRTFLDHGSEGMTAGEFADQILSHPNGLSDDHQYSSAVTGKEYRQILEAVRNDPALSRIEIRQVHVEPNGGGKSALLVDPVNNEAVVAFKGTERNEWADNFRGLAQTGQPDGVSTSMQESSLEWYRSLDLEGYDTITVTGHSKGGNKAKYITIMDDTVDRCFSMDGQGFSDEFIEHYSAQISKNQWKIENHNAAGDYVNILLNDVGETTYYQGTNYGNLGYFENHAANTVLHFDDNGNLSIHPSEQVPAMHELDMFINSYVRTLTSEEKKNTAELVTKVWNTLTSSETDEHKMEAFIYLLTREKNIPLTASLLASAVKYFGEYPEMRESAKSLLTANMDIVGKAATNVIIDIVGILCDINLNLVVPDFGNAGQTTLRHLLRMANGQMEVAGYIIKLLQELGLLRNLPLDDNLIRTLQMFLSSGLLGAVVDAFDSKTVPDRENGKDKTVDNGVPTVSTGAAISADVGGTSAQFCINCDSSGLWRSQLEEEKKEIDILSGQIAETISLMDITIRSRVMTPLCTCRTNTSRDAGRISTLSDSLNRIVQQYIRTENNVIQQISSRG